MSRLVVALLGLILIAPFPAAAKSKLPIKIAVTDSLSQQLAAHIAAAALKKARYRVELVQTDGAGQFPLIAGGEIHLQPQARPEAAGYAAAVESGKVLVLGPLGPDAGSGDKVIWQHMAKTWPGAVKVLRTFTLTSAHREALVAEVDSKGRNLEEVVKEWMAANRKVWKKWTASDGNWMRP